MKAISLLQPWASLVVMGVKQWETRSWNTMYRGRILIHASKGMDAAELCLEHPFSIYIKNFKTLLFGAIIGEVKIEATGPTEKVRMMISNDERLLGDYKTGRTAWKLVQAVQYKRPIPYKGQLNIWEFPDELLIHQPIRS